MSLCHLLHIHPHIKKLLDRDGTSHSIKGVEEYSALHPLHYHRVICSSFPLNLVSISSLVDHMDCWVTLDRENCLIEERRTGRKLGIGIRRTDCGT